MLRSIGLLFRVSAKETYAHFVIQLRCVEVLGYQDFTRGWGCDLLRRL